MQEFIKMLCVDVKTLRTACAAFAQIALPNTGYLKQIYALYEQAYPISGFYEIAHALHDIPDRALV